MTHFEKLSIINVNDKTEKKNNLTYLSWAWAWSEVKKVYPDATYNIKRFENGLPYVYDPLTGYMVFTDVTIEGLTHEMWLPVMDGANKAMKKEPYQYTVSAWKNGKKEAITKTCDAADMFDINKTIMRCLVKNLAMFGLGLYIYAGEDLPEEEAKNKPAEEDTPIKDKPTDRKARIEALCKHHGITMQTFGDYLKALQDEGKVANKTTAKMTEAEFGVLISLVHSGLNASKSA